MFELKLHGVRGSIPCVGSDFLKYGGDTTCIEIETDKFKLIFDAGTGFRNVELKKNEKPVYLFFSHFHHDHISGLAHNPTLHQPDCPINLVTALTTKVELRDTLNSFYSERFFPVDFLDIYSHINFVDFSNAQSLIKKDIEISHMKLEHPGGAAGYRVKQGEICIVLLFDNEYEACDKEALLDFCGQATVVLWDGMFTEKEYPEKKGWGHSTIEQAIKFGQHGHLDNIIICHHSPSRKDSNIDEIAADLPSDIVRFGADGDRFSFV
jgi:phosphoribosyl 1,2-cyclic phosphodiesterase